MHTKKGRPSDTHWGTVSQQQRWSVAAELELIDNLFDWGRFDRFLRWLDTPGQREQRYPPSILFRAMLLQHWQAFIAVEFEHEIDDRASFRRFIGLAPQQTAPTHAAICDFQRLLVERGVAVELFSELRQEIERHRTVLLRAAEGGKTHGLLNMAVESRPPGPEEWLMLEERFIRHWQEKRFGEKLPSSERIGLTDLKEFDRNLIVVRVLEDGIFRYEAVGAHIEEGNGGTLAGRTIAEVKRGNEKKYGHPGLQGELHRTYSLAVTQARPVGTSAYYMNLLGERCQMWTTQAPVVSSVGKIELLIGVGMIKRLTIN
jgi:hypothetical protein